MKIFRVATLIALIAAPSCVAVPAYAQSPMMNLMPEVKSKTPEEKEQDRINDKAYRESLRQIPDTKASTDPWGDVRGSGTPKATPAKSRTRTGSSAN
jgi:hypothetical protein